MTSYDPVAISEGQHAVGALLRVTYSDTLSRTAEGADALLIAREWKKFRGIDLTAAARTSKEPVIFAGRNKYDSRLLRERGIEYHAIHGQMAARS